MIYTYAYVCACVQCVMAQMLNAAPVEGQHSKNKLNRRAHRSTLSETHLNQSAQVQAGPPLSQVMPYRMLNGAGGLEHVPWGTH